MKIPCEDCICLAKCNITRKYELRITMKVYRMAEECSILRLFLINNRGYLYDNKRLFSSFDFFERLNIK